MSKKQKTALTIVSVLAIILLAFYINTKMQENSETRNTNKTSKQITSKKEEEEKKLKEEELKSSKEEGDIDANQPKMSAKDKAILKQRAENAKKINKEGAEKFKEIAGLAQFYGNLDSHIVILNIQGGPFLLLNSLDTRIPDAQAKEALFVNVQQVQTLNPEKFNKEITFDEAKKYDLESVEYINKVAKYFKNQGKKVYIMGMSYGAFATEQFIVTYGVDAVDGYLIAVGRLDIEKATWETFAKGNYVNYVYNKDGVMSTKPLDQKLTIPMQNMSKLAAGLGYHRYTTELKDMDLSNIIYVYGGRDNEVGRLTKAEVDFLKKRGAKVVEAKGKNHVETMYVALTGINNLIRDGKKELAEEKKSEK